MSLSKKQIVAVSAATGVALAAGALGWFLYDAYNGRIEQEEELEQQISAFRRFNDAPVFPSSKTISESKTNQASLVAWFDAARAYASRGDRKIAEETPPIFKQRLAATVRKMRSLPGMVGGKIAAPGFQFGFDAYLGDGGVLPDVKDVPRLAAQLDVIKHIVATLAKSGALEIKELNRIEPPPPEETQAKGKKKLSKKEKKVEEGPKPTSLEFGLSFLARPDAIVKILNAFSSDQRFIMVKNFAFKATVDDIVTRMDADAAAKAAAAANAGGTSRRRRRAASEAAPAENVEIKTGGLIADPEFGSPIQVDMTIVEWDFGTGGSVPPPNQSNPATKEAKK